MGEKYNIEKDIAAFIKKEFDKKYNPTWHCIVGRNFGSYVTHETKHFIYFYLGQVAILLFKSVDRQQMTRRTLRGPHNTSLMFADIPTPMSHMCQIKRHQASFLAIHGASADTKLPQPHLY